MNYFCCCVAINKYNVRLTCLNSFGEKVSPANQTENLLLWYVFKGHYPQI